MSSSETFAVVRHNVHSFVLVKMFFIVVKKETQAGFSVSFQWHRVFVLSVKLK